MIEQALLIGAASWRCAALLAYERGPFDTFKRLRERLGFTHKSDGTVLSWPDTFLAQMLSCIWCVGIWTTLAMWGLWQVSHAAIIVLAAASVLVALERWNHSGGS